MGFGLLGQVALIDDEGNEVTLSGVRQRTLLAALLLRPNEPVASDTLIEEVWDGNPPRGAAKSLRTYVMRLRATTCETLGREMAERIATCASGYLIRVGTSELDTLLFEALCRKAQAAWHDQRLPEARASARRAESLWRGQPLFGVESEALRETCRPQLERLQQHRLQAQEIRVEADLSSGVVENLVPELTDLAATHPTNERIHLQLMRALIRCGRQADALAVYENARRTLADEYGVDPEPRLQALHRQILVGATEPTPPKTLAVPRPLQRQAVFQPEVLYEPGNQRPTSGRANDVPVRRRRCRLTRRWRGRISVATGVAVAAVAALLIFGLETPLSATHTHTTAVLPTPSPRGYDPLIAPGRLGWLPANARNIDIYYWLPGGRPTIISAHSGISSGIPSSDLSPQIVLTIYPPGVTPPTAPSDTAAVHRISAPDVNGRPAYWMSESPYDPTNNGATFLRWQAGDGQWLELLGVYLASSEELEELHRVAAAVTVDP